jgi:hypothetical protein
MMHAAKLKEDKIQPLRSPTQLCLLEFNFNGGLHKSAELTINKTLVFSPSNINSRQREINYADLAISIQRDNTNIIRSNFPQQNMRVSSIHIDC